jgi:Sensors of blue-light using FAD
VLSMAYLSSASFPFSDGDLATLLMNSRANNGRAGVTGMLLYRDGQFLQVLEGAEQAVRERFARIEADPRHRDVHKLMEAAITERQFPTWNMGYRAVTDTLADVIPGYVDFFGGRSAHLDLTEKSSRARLLLEWFRHHSFAPAAASTV